MNRWKQLLWLKFFSSLLCGCLLFSFALQFPFLWMALLYQKPMKNVFVPPVDFSPVLRCFRPTSSLLSIRCISRRPHIVYFRLGKSLSAGRKGVCCHFGPGPVFSATEICFPLVFRINCYRFCCQLFLLGVGKSFRAPFKWESKVRFTNLHIFDN